jgi:cytochrome P450
MTTTTPGLDLSDLSLWEDGPPHELFAMLRREHPVHWSPLDGFPGERGFWSISRYADIAAVGRDHTGFSSEQGGVLAVDQLWELPGMPTSLELMRNMLICQDPPRHDRLKGLVQAAFTPKRALDHSDRMRSIINLVYDRALERNPDGIVDLVQDVGIYVPAMVIGDMLGVPRDDAGKLVNWTNRTTAFEDPRVAPTSEDTFDAVMEIFEYVNTMIEHRRATPTGDLTTALMQAQVDGEHLAQEEILMFWLLLMVAGNDSTRATFCSGTLSLLQDPRQMAHVRARPDLHDSAVEEFVRCHPAFSYMRRTAMRDTEIAGQPIAAGDKVLLWYVSGNRDETVFDTPDKFDVRRNPKKHQGFGGGGRHFCLGAGLSRLEMKLWLQETLRRFPEIELAGEPSRLSSTFLNQYRHIPVDLRASEAR